MTATRIHCVCEWDHPLFASRLDASKTPSMASVSSLAGSGLSTDASDLFLSA